MATKHDTAGWTYYTWDVDESLKTIQTPTVTLESKYNSRMQRVWRSENGTAEKLVYDAQKLIAEATSTGTALNRYYLSAGGSVYSPLLAQLGSEHWFLADALGTTLGLTSPTGSLTDTFQYEAFGTSLGRTGSTATPYQYVGGYGYFNEPSVGLEQVWHRWLNAHIGVWNSIDPLGIDRASYIYVDNDPAIYTDATGLGKCQLPMEPAPGPSRLSKTQQQHRLQLIRRLMRVLQMDRELELMDRGPIVVKCWMPQDVAGWTNPLTGTIYLNEDQFHRLSDLFTTLIEELQHRYDIDRGAPFRTHRYPLLRNPEDYINWIQPPYSGYSDATRRQLEKLWRRWCEELNSGN